ncbi:hypothetical protein [Actinomadura macra]|uniref:hypothetical protein n=1 Tax=Actinomadura macra TaxID=46164 RepID=UPI000B0B7B19|nr:hypothetical protein [Actinomadura macra]
MISFWTGEQVRLRGVEPEDWQAFKEFDQHTEDMRGAEMLHPPRSDEGYRIPAPRIRRRRHRDPAHLHVR